MSTSLRALKPEAGEGGKVALGCFASLVLHVIAAIVVAIIGGAIGGSDGQLLVLPFLATIPLTQWIYLAPAAWAVGRFRSAGIAKGLWISGAVMMLLAALCWGGMLVVSLRYWGEGRRAQEYARQHPMESLTARGVVTVVDGDRFEVRQDDGTVVSLTRSASADYVFLKANGGYEARTAAILKPGVRVLVDYWKSADAPPSASIIRVLEEGASRP